MKKLLLQALAVAALLAAVPQARAWSYTDGDLLLVFRKNSVNVEFDLGSVTNYLGKTNGYTVTVPNWDANLVTSTYGSLSGAKVILLAAGDTTNWLSSAEPNTTAYNIGQSDFDSLHGVINAVGSKPLYPIAIPKASTNAYVIDTGGQYKASSYDYVVSGGLYSGIPKLGGNAPFTVEQSAPGFLDFWQIQPSSVYPNPPADKLVGTFVITADGTLTFTAGPRSSVISKVVRAGSNSTVSFSTTVGNAYSLQYRSQLNSSAWTTDTGAGTITGNGGLNSLTRTNAGTAEFYRISTQ
ncbi:MAG TPA: hypothetical protein VF607_16105 [Verrucomicrobiae bacterium]